jgi:putative transposon-encoded protein
MKRNKKLVVSNEIKVENIDGYFERNVTKFGSGAKIDCLKEFIGRKVIVLVKKKRT